MGQRERYYDSYDAVRDALSTVRLGHPATPLSRRYGAQYLDPRVSATPPLRWTITPSSIHDRPTCPFSADDGAETELRKGPRRVSYEIKLRFRRLGCGTVQITGLGVNYI